MEGGGGMGGGAEEGVKPVYTAPFLSDRPFKFQRFLIFWFHWNIWLFELHYLTFIWIFSNLSQNSFEVTNPKQGRADRQESRDHKQTFSPLSLEFRELSPAQSSWPADDNCIGVAVAPVLENNCSLAPETDQTAHQRMSTSWRLVLVAGRDWAQDINL